MANFISAKNERVDSLEMTSLNIQDEPIQIITDPYQKYPWMNDLVISQQIKDFVREMLDIEPKEYLPADGDVRLLYDTINFETTIKNIYFWLVFSSDKEKENKNRSKNPIDMINNNRLTDDKRTHIHDLIGEALSFDYKRLNEWQSDNSTSYCLICRGEFGLITRRHHCRCCGKIQCSNCQKLIPLPHYGYNFKVRTCLTCVEITQKLKINTLFNHIDRCNRRTIDVTKTSVLLGVYNMYCQKKGEDNKNKFCDLGNKFFKSGYYTVCVLCYHYGAVDLDIWYLVIETLMGKRNYSLVYSCVLYLTKRLTKQDILKYAYGMQEKSFNDYGKLCLICYLALKLTIEELLNISAEYYSVKNFTMCKLSKHLADTIKKEKDEFKISFTFDPKTEFVMFKPNI